MKSPGEFFSEVNELVLDCKYQEARELALGVYRALCKTEDRELQVYAMLAKSQLTIIDQAKELLRHYDAIEKIDKARANPETKRLKSTPTKAPKA